MQIIATRAVLLLLTFLYTIVSLGSCAAPPPAMVYAIQVEVPMPVPTEQRLSILSAHGQASHSLLRAAQLYMHHHPDVLISVHTVGREHDYQTALRTRLLGGERVDLFHIFGYTDMIELHEHLEDISDLYWAREAIAGTLEPVSIGDQFFGLPHSVDGIGHIVNTRIFEMAEVSLADISSFDELEDAWRELREAITLGTVMRREFPLLESVTSLPGLCDEFLGRHLVDIALGGEFASASAAAGATSITYANNAAMGLYVSLLARYTTHGRGWAMLVDITADEQVENGLAAERVAAILQSTEIYPRVIMLNPELEGHLRLAPVFLRGAERGVVYTHAPFYWAINSNSCEQSRALARDFLTWLYRSEEGARFLAEEMGILSPFRDTAANTDNPLHSQLLTFISRGQYLPRRHRETPPGWNTESFANALREYFTVRELEWQDVAARNMQDWLHGRLDNAAPDF